METVVYTLQDNKNAVAFKYGPWVLSANMGNKDMQTSTTGVNVTVPLLESSVSDIISVKDTTVEKWLCNIGKNIEKQDNSLNFILRGADKELVFSPHYKQHKNRYGIYFRLTDSETKIKENTADKYTVIDSVPVGNDQYEFSHNLKCESSRSGHHMGYIFRDAVPGGYFSYELKIDKNAENYLHIKYFSGDAGRKFSISVDDKLLENVILENYNNEFYDVYYKIPYKLTTKKN